MTRIELGIKIDTGRNEKRQTGLPLSSGEGSTVVCFSAWPNSLNKGDLLANRNLAKNGRQLFSLRFFWRCLIMKVLTRSILRYLDINNFFG